MSLSGLGDSRVTEATALRGTLDIIATINQDNRYVHLPGGQGCQGAGSLCVNTMIDLTKTELPHVFHENGRPFGTEGLTSYKAAVNRTPHLPALEHGSSCANCQGGCSRVRTKWDSQVSHSQLKGFTDHDE